MPAQYIVLWPSSQPDNAFKICSLVALPLPLPTANLLVVASDLQLELELELVAHEVEGRRWRVEGGSWKLEVVT